MLDFSITEIGLIGLVALVAIGPERLPKVARGAGILVGRFRRYANSVKSEIDEEIRRSELKELQVRLDEATKNAHQSLQGAVNQTNEVLNAPVAEASPVAATPVTETPPVTPEPDHPALSGGLYLGGDAFVTRASGPSRSFPIGDLGRSSKPETPVEVS
jgi:sec-independent protein translocase protein TatB